MGLTHPARASACAPAAAPTAAVATPEEDPCAPSVTATRDVADAAAADATGAAAAVPATPEPSAAPETCGGAS